ncbi:hypothetical protein HID58_089021, partial [Brassica napus]
MRKLKYHEKKVLKKLNFLEWKREGAWPTAQQMDPTDPFRIQMTDMLLDKLLSFTYQRRLSTVLVHLKTYYSEGSEEIKFLGMEKRRWPTAQQMDPTDPFRIQMTDMLLEKLYNMGVIPTTHRLSTVLVHL